MTAPMLLRARCVVCGAGTLQALLTIPAYPVFQGCVAFAPTPNETAAMSWSLCPACAAAQITALPPLDRIYQAGHATGLGAAWARHHAAFANFVQSHADGVIVDVGGGSGTLAVAYRCQGGRAAWTILEPNALRTPALPSDVTVVDGFLEGDILQRLGASTVVMCHMFEHCVDLRDTVKRLSESLPAVGRILLAWPELERWVEKSLAGALNFEHGIYLTLPRLRALFAEFGWVIRSEVRWEEFDTRFLAFQRGPTSKPASEPNCQATAAAIQGYFDRFAAQARALSRLLDEHDGEAFLMPASIYAQALLAGGLSEDRFMGLLDNSAVKQQRRLYGTNLQVAAPEAALPSCRNPLVVLNGGAHEGEIAAGLRRLKPGIRLVRADATAIGLLNL
jgi:hypothetical protein